MPTRTLAEIGLWKGELHQALSSHVPMPEAICKDITAFFVQTDGAQVFPRPSAVSAHVQIAQLSLTKPLVLAKGAATPDQITSATAQFLITLFLDTNFGSDLAVRVALPIANQCALNMLSYLTATIPSTTSNAQDEEAVFGNAFQTSSDSSNKAGYSSVAKANQVYQNSARMAVAQALLVLTRRFQLTPAAAKEVTAVSERHILSYLTLCQTFGDAATDQISGKARNSATTNTTNQNYLGSGSSVALTTFMTIAHNVTHLILMAFANTYNSWGTVLSSGPNSTVCLEPNALLKTEQVGKDIQTWISALLTNVTDNANKHLDGIAASLTQNKGISVGGTGASVAHPTKAEIAAQDRARASVVQYVDGFVAIVTLIVGLFRIGQTDMDRGLDFVIDAFRGDRKEINDLRSSDHLKVFLFRGKVAKRMVSFCPPAARLKLPQWFIPELYFDILHTVTSDAALPALKHLSDLDIESCRIYYATLEEASALRQQQIQLQQNAGGGAMDFGRPTTYVGRTGSALTGLPATTAIAAPAIMCYPYTSTIPSICDWITFVFTSLPSRYLRVNLDDPSSADDQLAVDDASGLDGLAAEDNNIATFVFRNVLYHLKALYEVSGKSGVDSYASAASSALGLGLSAVAGGPTPESGLWDVFSLRAAASYSKLLAQLGGSDQHVAIRIFTTVLGESQSDCSELQWLSLLRQVRCALTAEPVQKVGGASSASNMGNAVLNTNDPFRYNERLPAGPSHRAGPSPLELSAAVMAQSSANTLMLAQQAFATNTLFLFANVAMTAPNSALHRAVPVEAILGLLDLRMISPDSLGAILMAVSALISTPEQQRLCWQQLEERGLLRVSNSTPLAQSQSGSVAASTAQPSTWAPSTYAADAEMNSLPGHCLRECRVGRYPITIALLRLLLKLIAVSATSSSPEALTILQTPTYRALMKFVADDVVCTLHRRTYALEEELYVLASVSGELLHDALLTFGTTSQQASAAVSTPYSAFHTLLATARAPNDCLAQLLIMINEAVADTSEQFPLASTRMCALRITTKLLYSAMYAIKVDRGLSDAVYTFNARTYDNTEFVISILRLCCGAVGDDSLVRRCFSILALIDSVVMGTTVRMIYSSHPDLLNTARFIFASVIDSAVESVAATAYATTKPNSSSTSELPCVLRTLDQDHYSGVDVPSTASSLIDLLLRNVHLPSPSLTTWLCGYNIVGAEIERENSCLEVVVAKVNDYAFCTSPATAPLGCRGIQLLYGLMCNASTATDQYYSILGARGNHSFLRTLRRLATVASEGADESDNQYSHGISLYDTISTTRHSIASHQLEFAGYAFKVLSLHLHRLSQLRIKEGRNAERAARDEHQVGGFSLRSLGRYTSEEAWYGGTSVLYTSHDPLILQLRKLVRLSDPRGAQTQFDGIESDGSDEEVVVGSPSFAGSSNTGGAFGKRMLEVCERLPAYPVLAVPGGSTDAFVMQTANRVPQYNIPSLSQAMVRSNPGATREETRENLRVFVYANSCLIAYHAATNYIRGWCELLEVVCSSTSPSELAPERLMVLADEIVSAIAITDKLTVSAQQDIVLALTQALCSVAMRLSEVKGYITNGQPADQVWAEESTQDLQALLTTVVRSLIRFRDVSAASRLNLYNVVRVLLSLAPLGIEPYIPSEDREGIFEVIISDVCGTHPASLGEAALSGILTAESSCELVALHCLRRFLQLPETLSFFAVASRDAMAVASLGNAETHEALPTTDGFWSPSSKLVSMVKSIFQSLDAACCTLFSGGIHVNTHAGFVLEYAECASDILSIIGQSYPHVLYYSGAVEIAFQMRCWELIDRSLNDQGAVAVISARHFTDLASGSRRSSSALPSGATVRLPPHVLRLFADVGSQLLASTLSWANVLFEEKSMRQHVSLVASSSEFLRTNLSTFQSICKASNFGARNAASLRSVRDGSDITPIGTGQLRLAEEVSLWLSALSDSPIAFECRSLIQLLNVPDLLLSFTASEMLTEAFFIDDEAETVQSLTSRTAYVQVPLATITYDQIGNVARTARNLSQFLLNTVHPILLKMRREEVATVAKIPSISSQLTSSQIGLNQPSYNLKPVMESTTVVTTTTAEDAWPLLESAFMTAIGVLLQQLTLATGTTIEWELRSREAGAWHSCSYLEAITSITLLAHSAVLQALLLQKGQPHLFASNSTESAAKAMLFHVRHLGTALSGSLQRMTEVQSMVLNSKYNATQPFGPQGGNRQTSSMTNSSSVLGGPHRTLLSHSGDLTSASLGDALDELNSSSRGAGGESIIRSRYTGGAAYDSHSGLVQAQDEYMNTSLHKNRVKAQLSHAGTMRLYQGVQKVRSLMLAACRDAEKLFVEQL